MRKPKAEDEHSSCGKMIRNTRAYTNNNPFRFATKYSDEDEARQCEDGPGKAWVRRSETAGAPHRAMTRQTKLIYYGLRYYSPSLGRFISRDPIGENGGQNLYAMVGNNAVNGIDYLGMWSLFGGAIKGGGDIDQERQWWDTGDGTGTQQLDDEDLARITEAWAANPEQVLQMFIKATRSLRNSFSPFQSYQSSQQRQAANSLLKAYSNAYQSLTKVGSSSSSSVIGGRSASSGGGESYPAGEDVLYGKPIGKPRFIGYQEGPLFDIPELKAIRYERPERIRRISADQFVRNLGLSDYGPRPPTLFGSKAYAETAARILSREQSYALGVLATFTPVPGAGGLAGTSKLSNYSLKAYQRWAAYSGYRINMKATLAYLKNGLYIEQGGEAALSFFGGNGLPPSTPGAIAGTLGRDYYRTVTGEYPEDFFSEN